MRARLREKGERKKRETERERERTVARDLHTAESKRLENLVGDTTDATSVHYFPCETLSKPEQNGIFCYRVGHTSS